MGYNTNGLGCHRWQDALQLLADVGYQSVAITLDQHWLDPFSPTLLTQLVEMRKLLAALNFGYVIETGARFLLDPVEKHEPTLMSANPAGRAVRIDFLKRAIDIAQELSADAVSFWSGILREDITHESAMQRLIDGCREITDYADDKEVQLAFEPEPGMFIETMEQFRILKEHIPSDNFGLTIDIGHLHCVEEAPISDYLREWSSLIFNIHIEDMCKGVHEHLRFGEGEIDFPPVIRTLREIDYAGQVNVELSRHSHCAPEVVQEAYDFLSTPQ